MVIVSDQRKPLYEGRKVTFEEYMNLPDDGFRYEITEGIMNMMLPAPFKKHQKLIVRFSQILSNYLDENPIGIVYVAPRDVKFSETITRQPDIIYISNERLEIDKDNEIEGTPDFIIEILSPGTFGKDIRDKYLIYERFGVKEYWIINPDNINSSEFYYLEGNKYTQFYPDKSIIYSKVITGFSVDLKKLEAYL